jgi:hypothetical protein
MPDDQVTLRFLRPHGVYRKGDTITYPRGPAKSLLFAGVCEIVPEERQLLEVAMVERRDVETADAPRRRGRKAK